MKKQEYLRQLAEKLSFLDTEARNAALSFYDEMLEDRIESGMTEEEALLGMEQPEALAERLRKELPEESRPSSLFVKPEHSEETYPICGLRGVRLNARNTPIRVEPCEGEQVTLSYLSTPEIKYYTQVQDGILTLDCRYTLRRRFFSFSFFSDMVTLKLPRQSSLFLEARTVNGSITLEGPLRLSALTATTRNGSLKAANIQSPRMELGCGNGALNLADLETEGDFCAGTSNASITACRLIAGGSMDLGTSNGTLKAEALRAGSALTLHTSNSSIHVARLLAKQLSLTTSNGAVQGTLPGSMADYAIESGTSNGRSSLPESQPGQISLSVHTSNNAIRLSFEEQ